MERDPLTRIQAVVNAQADDPALWFTTHTISEAYLQEELRKLHAVIEQGRTRGDRPRGHL